MIFVWIRRAFRLLFTSDENVDFNCQCPACGHREKNQHLFTLPTPENKLQKPAIRLQCEQCTYAWYVPTVSECA